MTIPGDPSTLVLATGVVALLAAVVHGRCLRAAGVPHDAAGHWTVANLLLAGAAVAMLARVGRPQALVLAGADVCELLAFWQLQRGLMRFTGQTGKARAMTIPLMLVAMLIPALYGLGAVGTRLLVYAGAAAWLLAGSARLAWQGLRSEFGREAMFAVAAPCALGAVLELARIAIALATSMPDVANSLQPGATNSALQWSAFAIILSVNFALAMMAGARQLARTHDLTLRDALTGAWNRRAIELRLKREISARRRHALPLALITFDLDHFKSVNDRHGHAVGDAALRHVVTLLAPMCRDGDLLARTGGEEFCVLMPYTSLDGALSLAERLRARLASAPLAWRGASVSLTGSFGVAGAEQAGAEGKDLPERADAAMYAAKAAGRNCVRAALDGAQTRSGSCDEGIGATLAPEGALGTMARNEHRVVAHRP